MSVAGPPLRPDAENQAVAEPKPPAHRNPLMAWLLGGNKIDTRARRPADSQNRDQASDSQANESEDRKDQHPWYTVMWLTGVDYFSSIAYQAGIALLAAGLLAPIATLVLVAVTLLCAVPVYREVARRSYAGQGSIAMLEHLVPGWWKKILVIVLLGFAGTDFVITMTLSAADSAQHAVENPFLKPHIGHMHMAVTIILLALLAAVFLRGFGEAIVLATSVAIPFILLNAIVLIRCGLEIAHHPELLNHWQAGLHAHNQSWTSIFIVSCLVFPRLALGLSGFETGVSVMPLIKGKDGEDDGDQPPKERIRNTGRLLLTAALLMSVLLIASSVVTALLIPADAYQPGGPANGRALATWLTNIWATFSARSTT